MRLRAVLLAIIAAAVVTAGAAAGDAPESGGGRVNNLKVLSDKIDDVTTAENILKSFVRPGMSDAERAKALWTAAVKYRHQTIPPNEYLAADWEAHDPVKLFNVYGYCMCCCCSAVLESLNRLDGREARGRILTGHSVPEVRYGGAWHMYDCSLITHFPDPDTGTVASVDDVSAALADWYAKNPGYRRDRAKLTGLMRSDSGTGWKSHGPRLLANCPFYTGGWLPARTHGWNDTMAEYDRKSEIYEYGYQVGHRALFSLRPGESFVREAGNRGLHVNKAEQPHWNMLTARAPEKDLVYLKEFFPGYRGGVVANGYHRYAPDLTAGGLVRGAEVYDNLSEGANGLTPRAPGKPGVAVIQLASPYVYLGGRLKLSAYRATDVDRVAVSLSTNNGRTFAPLWSAASTGPNEGVVELGDRILRRYAYWLKIEITAASAGGARLEALAAENDIQHAPRTLPWLGAGRNTITVASDADPALASRTMTCRITPDTNFTKNESTATMGVAFDNLNVVDGACWWKSGTGTMTVPVEVPGEIVALRGSTQIRARGAKDTIRLLVSFDGGGHWTEAARMVGPTPGRTETFRFTNIPTGATKALVRYELSGNNTVGIFSFRVDADYRDPTAARSFRPFDVIHHWTETGQAKTHRETVTKLPYTYTIDTAAAPEMVSVTYAMPGR
jgi:hypothetical protein